MCVCVCVFYLVSCLGSDKERGGVRAARVSLTIRPWTPPSLERSEIGMRACAPLRKTRQSRAFSSSVLCVFAWASVTRSRDTGRCPFPQSTIVCVCKCVVLRRVLAPETSQGRCGRASRARGENSACLRDAGSRLGVAAHGLAVGAGESVAHVESDGACRRQHKFHHNPD